jgi:hypothetical protein
MPHMMTGSEDVPLPAYFHNMDGFNISSYSFDMDSMLAILQRDNPNATFDGSALFMPTV